MRDDTVLLIDILEHARLIQQSMRGVSRERFDADVLLQYGVSHALQIIGEAARQLSDSARVQNASLAWTQIVGMRNRIVHEYFRIDLDRVWDTVLIDVPVMIQVLEPTIGPIIDRSKSAGKS